MDTVKARLQVQGALQSSNAAAGLHAPVYASISDAFAKVSAHLRSGSRDPAREQCHPHSARLLPREPGRQTASLHFRPLEQKSGPTRPPPPPPRPAQILKDEGRKGFYR